MATETKETAPAKTESKVTFGSPATIDTAEEVVQAYLRGQIDEADLRAGLAAFGASQVANVGIERPDHNFANKIPDDLLQSAAKPTSLEDRVKIVNEKAKEREENAKKTAEANA